MKLNTEKVKSYYNSKHRLCLCKTVIKGNVNNTHISLLWKP